MSKKRNGKTNNETDQMQQTNYSHSKPMYNTV